MKEGYCVTDEILNQEILKLTDWYTDDLFENNSDISIKASFSRNFCDCERFSDDIKEIMAKFGMGVLYVKTDSGEQLRKVTTELRQHILDNYYWKHHNRLTENVQFQLDHFGKATIVDCHSYPDCIKDKQFQIYVSIVLDYLNSNHREIILRVTFS